MDLKFSSKKSLYCDKTLENAISYLLKLGLSILFGDPLITRPKGQLISEWLFGVFNFPKKHAKIWWISALESKNWSNQKDKGTLLC